MMGFGSGLSGIGRLGCKGDILDEDSQPVFGGV